MIRPEGFEEYITTLTFVQKKLDPSLLSGGTSVISGCADFDLDHIENPLRLEQCYLLQMKVSILHCKFRSLRKT